jgi:hypothetical protein
MNIIGVDPGKDGGIALPDGTVISMPIKKVLVKKAVTVFARDNSGNKIVYKSGKHKGDFKMDTRTPAKYNTELDCREIDSILLDYIHGLDMKFVIEMAGNSIGNSAKTTATTHYNIGKLHALAEANGYEIVVVTAAKWKGDLKLTAKHLGLSKQDIKDGKHKILCTERAEELSGMSFRGPQGGIKDGQAEAWLIKYWYENYDK